MNLISVVTICLCFSFSTTLPSPEDGDDMDLLEYLPKVFQDFYEKLNETDLNILESLAADLAKKNPDEMYKIIKPESEELAENVKQFYKEFLKQIEKFSHEAKEFMNELFTSFTGIRENDDDEADDDFAEMAISLSKEAKAEIVKAFPSMKEMLTDNEGANSTIADN